MPPDLVEPIGLKKGKRLDDLDHKSIEEDEYKPRLKQLQLELLNYSASSPRRRIR